MEELVPLEVKNKKKFEKKVKGIQDMIKSGKVKINEKGEKKQNNRQNFKKRGVIYVGHIPHGFYEDQLRKFFGQFGTVTNVRVGRSQKNARSKGYAFVQFKDIEVAQIAAETMNNYLMDKRLLKAEYIPPERQHASLFKGRNWVQDKYCPGVINKMKNKAKINKQQSEEEWIGAATKTLKRIMKIKESLKKIGIDYDFFQPCDIPPQLKNYETDFKKTENEDKPQSVNNGDSKKAKKQADNTKTPIVATVPAKKKNLKVDARQRSLLTFNLDKENEKELAEKKTKSQEKPKVHKMQEFAGVMKQKEKQKNKQGMGKKNKK